MNEKRDMVLTCCRDEEDIIGTFICFYLDFGFDAVHVIDNGSSDSTVDVIKSLITQGLPVTLELDERVGYERYLSEWFKCSGERFSARWLFFLDCDEFILFPSSVKTYFAGLPTNVNRLTLKQKEIYPVLQVDNSQTHFLLSKRAEPDFNDTTKDVTQFHPQARVYAGKHRVEIPGACTVYPSDIYIRHYKYRTPSQARRKEENRCAHQSTYKDTDLEIISSFGVERTRQWIQYCREAAADSHWLDSFRPDIEAVDDSIMADWARGFLERHREHEFLSAASN